VKCHRRLARSSPNSTFLLRTLTQTGLAHNSDSTSVEFKARTLSSFFSSHSRSSDEQGELNTRRNCSHPAIGPLHCWPNPQRDESEPMSLYLLLGFLHDEAGRLRRDISPSCTALQLPFDYELHQLIEKSQRQTKHFCSSTRNLTRKCRNRRAKSASQQQWYVFYSLPST